MTADPGAHRRDHRLAARRLADRAAARLTGAHVCAVVVVDVRELEDATALVDAARALGTHAALEVALDLTGGIVRVLLERAEDGDAERVPCPPE